MHRRVRGSTTRVDIRCTLTRLASLGKAKALKWKTYIVFQRKVMLEINRTEPQSLRELERIPELGPAKVARFGDDILELVRAHGRNGRGSRS